MGKLLGRPRKKPPTSREAGPEWEEVAEAAQFGLELDSMFQYGLVESVMEDGSKSSKSPVRTHHCEVMLRQAARLGITPKKKE